MKTVLYLLGVVVVAGLLSSSALALTPFGPPVATLEKGDFATGFSYCQSKVDFEGTFIGISGTLKDVEVDTYMANLVWGITDNWELQFDLGAADVGKDYEIKGNFAGGVGFRTTFRETGNIKWGGVFMAHWYKVADSGEILGIPWTEEDRWSEIQIAIGPSYEDEKWRLYGGPFLHFIDGDIKGTIAGVPVSGDFEQDSIFGGFIGSQIDISDNVTLGIEYQLTGSANAIGANILFRF